MFMSLLCCLYAQDCLTTLLDLSIFSLIVVNKYDTEKQHLFFELLDGEADDVLIPDDVNYEDTYSVPNPR